jgi:hypothetical protein
MAQPRQQAWPQPVELSTPSFAIRDFRCIRARRQVFFILEEAYYRYRRLGAGLSVSQLRLIIGLAFTAIAVAALSAFRHSGFGVLAVVLFLYLSLVMVTIAVLLEYPRLPRQAMMSELADDLEKRQLLVSTTFSADRAFRVDEANEEGPHYFLELEDESILHLSGPYLYDYEPGDGSLRHFPCTRFTVRRHSELGHVVDMLCGGLIIEPEAEAPPYTARDFARRLVPKDGEILHTISFDRLLQERVGDRYRIH